MNEKHILSLNGEAFGALKQDFDGVLIKTLNEMMEKDIAVGKVTITLNISLEDGYAYDSETNGYEGERKTVIPKFSHKVKSALSYSDERQGFVGGGAFELVWDKNSETWLMVSVDDQVSLYDADDNALLDGEADDDAALLDDEEADE